MLQVALKPIATFADTPPATGGTADTYNWDTVFVLPYSLVNPAIAANWTAIEAKPPMVQDDSSGVYTLDYTLNITFGAWQVASGGDGKNVNFTCPIQSGGTFSIAIDGDPPSKVYTFEATVDSNGKPLIPQIEIQVGMQWIPGSDEPYVGLSSSDVPTIQTALAGGQIPSQLVTDLQDNKINLSSSATVVAIDPSQPELAWKITDGANSYYLFYNTDKEDNAYIFVYQFGDAWAANLKALSENLGNASPPVVVNNIINSPIPSTAKANAAMLASILSSWFNDNLDVFNHVFAALNISTQIDQTDQWKWLKPTGTSYAVVDEGTNNQSLFGVLTMTGGQQALPNHQISPNAIPADGSSNAGFLISGSRFMQNIMLPGAMAIFDSKNLDDFTISNDYLSVTNANDLTWGPFITNDTPTHTYTDAGNPPLTCDIKTSVSQLDNGSTAGFVQIYWGSGDFQPQLSDQLNIPPTSSVIVKVQGSEWCVVDSSNANNQFAIKLESGQLNVYSATQLHIPAKQFTMTLNHSQIDVSFVNINYAYSSDYNVNINYNESWTLGLKQVNGRNIFWYTDVFNKGLVISVTKTQSAITREIVEGAIAGVLTLIAIAGPIFEGLYDAAQIGEITDDGAVATVDSKTFAQTEAANPTQAKTDEVAAGGQAANQAGGKWANIKAAFKTPKWKNFGKITALVGLAAGLDPAVDAIIENAANNTWENVPSFDAFANLCIAPYTFPNVTGFTLNSAQLADSLQIGLIVKS